MQIGLECESFAKGAKILKSETNLLSGLF